MTIFTVEEMTDDQMQQAVAIAHLVNTVDPSGRWSGGKNMRMPSKPYSPQNREAIAAYITFKLGSEVDLPINEAVAST